MKKSIIQCIREFIETYPELKDFKNVFKKVDIDKLEEDATAYMIETVPAEPIIKKYMDGSSIRQTVFALSSREYYTEFDNEGTAAFYDDFSAWVERCNDSHVLPKLPEGMESQSIKLTTNGYLMAADADKCQYRIQGILKYYQKPLQGGN